MPRKTEIDRRVKILCGDMLGWVNDLSSDVATKHRILVGDLTDTRCRTRQISGARAELVKAMRAEIVYRNNGQTDRQYALRYDLGDQVDPGGWSQISMPDVAAILRMHHTGILYLLRRRLREATKIERCGNPYADMLTEEVACDNNE